VSEFAATVEGDEALRATLGRVAGELDNLTEAGQTGGREVQRRAQSAAPVATGALARSIRAEATGTEITVGTPVPYAPFQEYGTVYTPASPYLRPALEAATTQVVDAYTGEIQHLLETVKGA
jgi:HK97 gp10 family phage protein